MLKVPVVSLGRDTAYWVEWPYRNGETYGDLRSATDAVKSAGYTPKVMDPDTFARTQR